MSTFESMDPLQPKQQSFFDLINARSAFWLGFVTAILVLGTVGFIILGNQILRGGSFDGFAIANTQDDSNLDNTDLAAAADVPAAEPTSVAAVSDDDHIRGDKNAEITVIEYSDFECPFCGNFHPTMQQVMTNYAGKVRWVYRHFPLSFHPSALPAANAAECASEQGKFWEYADQLFANQEKLGDAYYKQLATETGLNTSQWQDCYNSSKYDGKIQAQSQEGAGAGVSGTPGSFIIGADGTAIPIKGALPYSSVSAAIDKLLSGK